MRSTTLLAVLLTLALPCLGQDTTATPRCSSIQLGPGAFGGRAITLFASDVPRLAPGSVLLGQDLADHEFRPDRHGSGEELFEMSVGLRVFDRLGTRAPELRVGVLYGRTQFGATFSRHTSVPYDTLTSSQTGQQFIVDSVSTSTYDIRYSAERIGLHGALVWSRPARWTLYAGIGVMGGALLNARTEVTHQVLDEVEHYGYDDPYRSRDRYVEPQRELHRNSAGWWAGAYVPFGVDFRLARTSPFWSRIHLCYELRPMFLVQGVPEIGTNATFGIAPMFLLRLTL